VTKTRRVDRSVCSIPATLDYLASGVERARECLLVGPAGTGRARPVASESLPSRPGTRSVFHAVTCRTLYRGWPTTLPAASSTASRNDLGLVDEVASPRSMTRRQLCSVRISSLERRLWVCSHWPFDRGAVSWLSTPRGQPLTHTHRAPRTSLPHARPRCQGKTTLGNKMPSRVGLMPGRAAGPRCVTTTLRGWSRRSEATGGWWLSRNGHGRSPVAGTPRARRSYAVYEPEQQLAPVIEREAGLIDQTGPLRRGCR